MNEQGVKAATDAFGELLDPDFELEEAANLPDQERYSGKDAFIANMAKLDESFEDLRIEPIEFVDRSLKGWISRGRKENDGVHADFAAAVAAVLAAGARKTADMTPDEHRALVAERCRNGNVTAMKLMWAMLVDDRRRERTTPKQPAAVDPLAQPRRACSAARNRPRTSYVRSLA